MNPIYLARKARGRCADCGKPKAAGRSRCAAHLAVHAERARAYREKVRDARKKKSGGA